MPRYTREELLDAIERYVKEFGKQPSSDDMSAAEGYPSAYTYWNRFGSWNAALREAGLEPSFKSEHAEDELLNAIRSLAKDLGRTPSSTDMNDAEGAPHTSTYQERFGSWSQAVEAAGLDAHTAGYSESLALMEVSSLDEYDRGPTGEAIVATEFAFSDRDGRIHVSLPQRLPIGGVEYIADEAVGAVDSTGGFEWLVIVTASEQAEDHYLRLSDLPDGLDEPVGEVFE